MRNRNETIERDINEHETEIKSLSSQLKTMQNDYFSL